MRQVRFHPAAAEEAEEAAAWYESEMPGLGEGFVKELTAAIALLRKNPVPSVPIPHPSKRLGARRLLLGRFPYDVVFVERGDSTVIVAVAHQRRRPGYWKARLRA